MQRWYTVLAGHVMAEGIEAQLGAGWPWHQTDKGTSGHSAEVPVDKKAGTNRPVLHEEVCLGHKTHDENRWAVVGRVWQHLLAMLALKS